MPSQVPGYQCGVIQRPQKPEEIRTAESISSPIIVLRYLLVRKGLWFKKSLQKGRFTHTETPVREPEAAQSM